MVGDGELVVGLVDSDQFESLGQTRSQLRVAEADRRSGGHRFECPSNLVDLHDLGQ